MNDQHKSDLDFITHEIAPSQIADQLPEISSFKTIDLVKDAEALWMQVISINSSSSLLTDYLDGVSLGKFGDSTKINSLLVIKRLFDALKQILINEYKKLSLSSESLRVHFEILNNIIILIIKDYESNVSKINNTKNIIAQLHGYMESFVNESVYKPLKIKMEST